MKKYKEVLVEQSLGSAAAKPHATVEKGADILKINFGNKDLYPAEEHKQAEEVKEVIVEGVKYFVPKRLLKEEETKSESSEAAPSEEVKAEMAESEMPYKDKFEALLKEFGVSKISELSDEKKTEFFNTLDEIHVSKEESGESSEAAPLPEAPEQEVLISESVVKAKIKTKGKKPKKSVTKKEMATLQESLRTIYGIFASRTLREEETVEVPVDVEADVKVEGDKLVVEIPVESPKEMISEPEAAELQESLNTILSVLF
jgi:hypothetical protein